MIIQKSSFFFSRLHFGLLLFALVAQNAHAASLTITTVETAPATPVTEKIGGSCERDIQLILDSTGKMVDVKFEQKTPEALTQFSSDIANEIVARIDADPFSNKTVLISEYFLDFSQNIFDLVRTVTQKFSGLAHAPTTKSLEDIQTLLYGAGSLNTKIQELSSLLESKPFFTSAASHKNKIEELGETIRQCRGAISACKIELPSVLNSLNAEYKLLKKTKAAVENEILLLQKLKELLASSLAPEEARLVESLLTRKSNELNSGLMTLDVLLDGTNNLVNTINQVSLDANSVNDGALQRAVIKAAQQQIDLRRTLDADDPMMAEGEEMSSSLMAVKEISRLAKDEFLVTEKRFGDILTIVRKTESFTKKEALQIFKTLFSWKGTAPSLVHDRIDNSELYRRARIQQHEDILLTFPSEHLIGTRTHIFEAVLLKLTPTRDVTAVEWSKTLSDYLHRLNGDDNAGRNKFRPVIAGYLKYLANRQ